MTSNISAARRRRAGVEPARDRSAAPTGFEVRPTHRGRFSSVASIGGSLDLSNEGCFVGCLQAPAIQHKTVLRDPADHWTR